jgi:hypothetical protein
MSLKEELALAKEELTFAQGLWKKSPHYIAAVANVDIIAKREREKYEPEVKTAEKKYNDLYAQVQEHEKQPELPEEVKEFFKDVRYGIDWGPVDFRMRWQSADRRYIIMTVPGSQYWSSRGEHRYGSSHHHLIDLDAWKYWKSLTTNKRLAGMDCLSFAEKAKCEGRLKPLNRDMWILETVELSKVPYAPSKDSNS